MIEFSGRDVLLVSPQPWGELHISKHHYALELARRGARVFFIDPPGHGSFKTEEVAPRILRVTHSLGGQWWRFKARPVYDLLARKHVRSLVRWLRANASALPAVTWCFDANLYADLEWFDAPIRIFHPVDPITRPFQTSPARSASLLLSVSDKIMSSFDALVPSVPRCVINHGVNETLAGIARAGLAEGPWSPPATRPRIGYVGNLSRTDIDRPLLLELVDAFPQADFVFWGPLGDSTLGETDPAARTFLDALRARPHVELRGPRPSAVLAREISSDADAFLLTYRFVPGISDRSNAHKLLEYLATGKPVISVRISHYEKHPGLILMPGDDDDSKVKELLGRVISVLTGNAGAEALALEREARKRRREFALDNTYERQVSRVAELL